MKNKLSKLILPVFIFITANTFGQTSGKVMYEGKTKLNIDIDSDHQEEMRNLPKEHIVSNELIFDSAASLFQNATNQNKDESFEKDTEKGKMVIKLDQPDNHFYCDLIEKKKLEQRDFLSRKFLIEISFSNSTWKLTGKQKMILNYTCQEAILQDTTRQITAWFTSSIPVSTGPYGICNLPGLVLAAELRGGDLTFEAKSVDLMPIDHKSIIRPTEGKKVTREEFNKMVMEKNKEMEEQGGGNGNVIIHIKK